MGWLGGRRPVPIQSEMCLRKKNAVNVAQSCLLVSVPGVQRAEERRRRSSVKGGSKHDAVRRSAAGFSVVAGSAADAAHGCRNASISENPAERCCGAFRQSSVERRRRAHFQRNAASLVVP